MKKTFWGNARLLIIIATLCFSTMAASIKAVSPKIPLYEAVFFRSIISALALAAILSHKKISFRAKNIPLLMTRSLSGLMAMTCNFYVLGHLSLGDTSMLVNTFPVFVAILSYIFLGERPSKSLLSWILIAIIGIALILKPQLNILNFSGFIAILSSLLSAVVVVTIHQSHETDPALRIAFYFTSTASLISLPIMLQNFIWPTSLEWFLLFLAGFFGTGGQILMTQAYGLEDVSRLSPLAYLGVVYSFILGMIFWKEMPSWTSLAGSLIVILCCIQIAQKKHSPSQNT